MVDNYLLAQVNNIKKRSQDNQNDRNINRNFTPPSNNSGGFNSSTPPARQEPSYRSAPNNNYNTQPQQNYNWYSRPSTRSNSANYDATEISTASGFGSTDACCIGIESIFSSFINHQNFLIQSKVVNPRIVSFEFFALGALPFLYDNDSIGSQFFPKSILSIPKIRANWGLLSTEFRYANLYQRSDGNMYETLDWQVLMLNIFSRREFYLRIGTGFMYEKPSFTYFNEHSLSADILFTEQLSGTFDFRFSHDSKTQIFPRLESGIRFNYLLAETRYAQFGFTAGFLYQNYYQTDKLYLIQTGLTMLLH